jgi:hypothetical protein
MRETNKIVKVQSCADGLFICFGENFSVNAEKITGGNEIFSKAFRDWIEDETNEVA